MAAVLKVVYVMVWRGDPAKPDDPKNPFRPVDQYWSLDGRLLAERDPIWEAWEDEENRDSPLLRRKGGLSARQKRRMKRLQRVFELRQDGDSLIEHRAALAREMRGL